MTAFQAQQADLLAAGGIGRTVLIIDDHEAFASGLSHSFTRAGFDVELSTNFANALRVASDFRPGLVVAEIKLDAMWIFQVCESFRRLGSRVAVATAYPSIATATRAVRAGIGVYLAKPVTAEMVLLALGEDEQALPTAAAAAPSWPSLDRTIWEYINQVFVQAGSMSEAARRLRLDRRSLRRMLAKHPPTR